VGNPDLALPRRQAANPTSIIAATINAASQAATAVASASASTAAATSAPNQ